jgi:hypothetical protein
VAAARGHEVTVFASGTESGGKLRLHAALPGGESLSSVYDYQQLRAAAHGVRFEFGVRAGIDELRSIGAEAVVLACGATPAWPRWLPDDYHDLDFFPDVRTVAARFVGRSVRESGTALIVDQDHTSFTYATAVLLAKVYERVVIATAREGVAAEEALVNRQGIQRRLAKLGIEVKNFCEPVFDDGLAEGVVTLVNVFGVGSVKIEGVSLLTHATPRVPRDELVAPLRAAGVELAVIGDCQAPRSLLVATGEGYRAGMRW